MKNISVTLVPVSLFLTLLACGGHESKTTDSPRANLAAQGVYGAAASAFACVENYIPGVKDEFLKKTLVNEYWKEVESCDLTTYKLACVESDLDPQAFAEVDRGTVTWWSTGECKAGYTAWTDRASLQDHVLKLNGMQFAAFESELRSAGKQDMLLQDSPESNLR